MAVRASTALLAIASVVAVALGVGLFVLTREDAPPPPAPPQAKPLEQAPVVAAPTTEPPQAEATPPPVAPNTAPHASPHTLPPILAVPLAMVEPDGKRDANGKLVPIVTVAELKKRFRATDAPMQACVEQSSARPTGKATLAFTVSAKDGKLVVESTGVDDDATLAPYPELLACMHDTAHALPLADLPVPELGTTVYVRRHVRLDAGAIVENSIFNFSYNR